MNIQDYTKLINRTSSLQLGMTTPAVLTGALYVNQRIPLLLTDNCNKEWAETHYPEAKRIIDELANNTMVDKTMTLEIARRIYAIRHRHGKDPLSILFNVLTIKMFEAELDRGDYTYASREVYQTAFSMTIEIVHRNRREIAAMAHQFSAPRSAKAIKYQMVEKIFEVFECSMDGAPEDTMVKMRVIVEKIIGSLADFYLMVFRFTDVSFSTNALMLKEIIESLEDSAMKEISIDRYVNEFYGKEVFEPKLDSYTAESVTSGYIIGHRCSAADDMAKVSETMDAESIDETTFDDWCDRMNAQLIEDEKAMELIMTEGVSRADAITFLGLDPVKDRKELSKFPVKRDGEYNEEIVLGIFKSIKKLGRGLIRSILRVVENIINSILKLLGKPFDLEPSVVITDSGKLAQLWGKTFNTGLDDLLEANPTLAKEIPTLQTAINSISMASSDLLNQITRYIDEMNRLDLTDAPQMNEKNRQFAEQYITAIESYNHSVFMLRDILAPFLPDSFPKGPSVTYAMGDNGRLHAEAVTRLPGSVLISEASGNVSAALRAKVKERRVTREEIEKLFNNTIKVEEYEESFDKITDTLQNVRKDLRRVKTEDMEIMDVNPRSLPDALVAHNAQALIRESTSQVRAIALDAQRLGVMIEQIVQRLISVRQTWLSADK